MASARISFVVIVLALCALANCWSTSITESCTTRLKAGPGTTKTITQTRYVQHVNATTITPTRYVFTATTTSTSFTSLTSYAYLSTSTYTVTFEYVLNSYVFKTVTTTTTATATITRGSTTTTISTPSGFEPAASIPLNTTQQATPLPGVAVALHTRLICHEKYILVTDIDTTIFAPTVVTSTETDATATVDVYATTTLISLILETLTVRTDTSTTSYWKRPVTTTEFVPTTSTTSTTTIVPTQTVFPGCTPDNVIDQVAPGLGIVYWDAKYNPLYISTISNSYDCCMKCFSIDNCTGTLFKLDYFQCALYIVSPGRVCDASTTADFGFYWSNYTGYERYHVSNGPCGRAADLGEYYGD